jgi:hypothetical protein
MPLRRNSTIHSTDAAFAIATRDELWIDGRLAERRLSHGSAIDDGARIIAVDSFDAELVRACDDVVAELREDVDENARVRLVGTARRVRGVVMIEATMTITVGGVSVVLSVYPERSEGSPVTPRDLVRRAMARASSTVPATRDDERSLATLGINSKFVWRNGSAAVLLHEAIGHAAEHSAMPVEWPAWLTVHDEPTFPIDDIGNDTRAVDLMREAPASLRRESFRDVPLRRMTNVVVRQHDAPFDLPSSATEIDLIAGGSYDPLTDTVTIHVAASSAGAFTLRRTRAEVAASLAGAFGEPLRYPGVICSREGQELAVGSFAPVMITR